MLLQCQWPVWDSVTIFMHEGSLSVNDAVIQEDLFDACGWSRPERDSTELETEHFQCGLRLMSQ